MVPLDTIKLISQQYGQSVLGVVILIVLVVFVMNPQLDRKAGYEEQLQKTTADNLKISENLKEVAGLINQSLQIQERMIRRPSGEPQ